MGDFQPGRQVVVDRLKRRLGNYRHHHNLASSHYDEETETHYEEQNKQTIQLKQRFIESKAKKTKKNTDHKKQENNILISANMGQSKLLARTHDQAGCNEEGESAAKKPRLANGSLVPSDISEFQMVQQLQNLKQNSSSPAPSNTVTSSSAVSNTISVPPPISCSDSIEGLPESSSKIVDGEDIKKESDLDLPNDSLLEGFGEFTNFGDIDMGGINLDDFVNDLDLDNIKHENNDPGIDSFFKAEENLFEEENASASTDSGIASAGSNAPNIAPAKVSLSSTASTTFSQFSNTQSMMHSSTASSFDPASFSTQSSISFSPASVASPAMSASYCISSGFQKMRSIPNMNQNEISPAAQTLKQLAEPYQTKLSPNGTAVRPMGDYNFNSLGNASIGPSQQSAVSQGYASMNNSIYNQSLGNIGERDVKRRQQLMQQFSLQQQQPQLQNQQSNMVPCNQVPQNISMQGQPGMQSIQQQRLMMRQQQVQLQSKQQNLPLPMQCTPPPQQASQMQQNPQIPHSQQQIHQQTLQIPQVGQVRQQSPQMGQQPPQQQQTMNQAAQQPSNSSSSQQQLSPQQQQPTPSSQSLGTSQQSSQPQQQSQLPCSQSPQHTQSLNQQSPQLSANHTSFSNRLSPMNSFSHSSPAAMNAQFNNGCNTMNNPGIRGSYPCPPRGSSPVPSGPQAVSMTASTGQPPRYIQQQMMPSVGMMRGQMIQQSGQVMSRPPPPEYRQAAMMQQHQTMVGQPMSQLQGMGQMSFMGMRPCFRANASGSPMNSIHGGQIIGAVNQQSIPGNIQAMKGSNTMMAGNTMNSPINMDPSMGGAGMANPGMVGGMNQSGGNMGIMNTRPMMQRARAPSVNMGGMPMNAQMAPSRAEWRQMMLQQNQNGVMVSPTMRHSFQQQPQQGTLIAQGGQMLPMQRPQAGHMIGMMGPGMQTNSAMSPGVGLQGNSNISPASMSSASGPMQNAMQLGPHMQHNMGGLPQQGQIRLGVPMNQQAIGNMADSHPPSLQNHSLNAGSMNQMNAIGIGQLTSTNSGSPIAGGVNAATANINQMSANNIPSMNHMNVNRSVNQAGGVSVNVVPQRNQQQSPSSLGVIGNHPRSPASTGQIHPCSPVASVQGVQQPRPLSNPGMNLPSSQTQNLPNLGRTCSLTTNSTSPCIISSQAPNVGGRHVTGGVPLTGPRTTNQIPHQTLNASNLPLVSQNVNIPHQTQSLGGAAGGSVGNSANMILNKAGAPNMNTPRPDSAGGGNGRNKTSQPSTPNPPSVPPTASSNSEFDLMFHEGDFASLLN